MFRRTWPKRWWPSGPEDALQLRADCDKLRKLAVPGAMMLALEAWAFEVSSLLAGLLRNLVALDAHIILLNVCGFVFFVPFRARHRREHSRRPAPRRRAGAGGEAGDKSAPGHHDRRLLAARRRVPRRAERHRASLHPGQGSRRCHRPPRADGGHFSGLGRRAERRRGALRGMGRQKMVALLNFVGFWLIGTSIGAALTFSDAFGAAFGGGGGSGGDSGGEHDDDDDHDDSLGGSGKGAMGVAGLWWGLAIGISATSVVGVASLSQTNFQREAALARARVVVAKEDGNRSEVGMNVQL